MRFDRLVIVDNSLKTTAGHHYEYARAVHDEALRRGMTAIVAAHRDAVEMPGETMQFRRVFRWTLYDSPIDRSRFPRLAKALHAVLFNIYFLVDWSRSGLRHLVTPQTLLFIPNCIEVMVFSLVILHWSRPSGSRPRMVCFFRRDPRVLMPFVGRMLKRYVREGSVQLVTDSEVLARHYEALTHLPFTVLPIPHQWSFPVPGTESTDAEGPFRITYLGDARIEKGIDLLAQSLSLLEQEMTDGRLVWRIQCHSVAGEPGIGEALRQLDAMHAAHPGQVELFRRPLSTEEYFHLLVSSDGVAVPYRRIDYQARTSGILAEAIAAGKPVIATEGTWLSGQVEAHGAGIVFRDGDPADFARAVRQLYLSRKALGLKAAEQAARWRDHHSAARLLDILLDRTGGERGAGR